MGLCILTRIKHLLKYVAQDTWPLISGDFGFSENSERWTWTEVNYYTKWYGDDDTVT